MDEIRCPMCGKLNPPELDNCQYCQARLKPLFVSQSPLEDESQEEESRVPSAGDEEKIPDWLDDLRSDDESLPDQEDLGIEEESPDEASDEADWLDRLQDQILSDDEEQTNEDSDAESIIEEVDLLERLGKINPEAGLNTQQEGDTDWSSSIEPAGEVDLPDWLDEIRPEFASQDRDEGGSEPPSEPAAIQEDERLPDWLSEIEPAEAEGRLDWTQGAAFESSSADISGDDMASAPEDDEEFEEAEEAGEERREGHLGEEETWLSDADEDQAEDLPPIEEGLEEGEEQQLERAELPDWLVDLQDQDFTADEEENKEDPGWLEQVEQGITPEADETELPEWLAPIDTQEEEPEAQPEEVPEWLSGLEVEETEGGVEQPQEEAEEIPEEEGPPEWMAELEKEFPSETGEEGEVVSMAVEPVEEEVETAVEQPQEEVEKIPEEEGPPEWMAELEKEFPSETEEGELVSLASEEGVEEVEAAIEQLQEDAEEILEGEEPPEWMAELEKEFSAVTEEGGEAVSMAAEEGAEEDEAAVEVLQEGAEEILEGEEPPEWMAELEKEFSAVTEEGGEAVSMATEEGAEEDEAAVDRIQEVAGEILEEEGPPEWLADLEKEFSSATAEESLSTFAVDEEGLEEVEQAASPSAVEEGVEFLESVPDWAEEVPVEEEAEGEGEPGELEEAEVPSWLEAIRPVETVAPQVTEEEQDVDYVETSGPLAGLKGLLVAESDFSRFRKPPAYSIKLRVTESQEARVALLREMLESEDKPKPLPARSIITPQYVLRLIIALLLIFPIAWSVISGSALTPMPDPASVPAGVLEVRRLIDNQLSMNTPVLVAFDYEAGFSSELDIASKAVLSHMMDKGAYLTLVSTSSSGPLLAERLISNLNQTSTREANPFTNYANLGYIPGGTAGLLSLAQSPQQAVPFTLDSVVIWDSAPLNVIENVADFNMVLVLTENSETARAWIEQVQPFLEAKATPLLLVVSAQAEPLVLPYYQGNSQQVQGLIVGYAGGVAYDTIRGQANLASGSWDAFSLSMLITEIILIVGAAFGAGAMLLTSSKKEEG